MIDKYHKRVLILAVRAGEMMMKAGAEIYRVEDTITRKYRLENTLRMQIPPGADMQAELDELGAEGEVESGNQQEHNHEGEVTLRTVVQKAADGIDYGVDFIDHKYHSLFP